MSERLAGAATSEQLSTVSLLTCSCEDVDAVRVYTVRDGSDLRLGTYCGNSIPPLFMSSNQQLKIVFTVSESTPTGVRGFKATYRFVTSIEKHVTGLLYQLFFFTDCGIQNGEQVQDMGKTL